MNVPSGRIERVYIFPVEVFVRVSVPVYGLSAHCGSGGFLMTGQVGPTRAEPDTVMSDDVSVVPWGQVANSHDGPLRLTYEPSGHCFASMVHAPPFGGFVGRGVTGGS